MLLKQVFSFCKEACGLYIGPYVKNLEMPTRERERGPELFPPATRLCPLEAPLSLLVLYLFFFWLFSIPLTVSLKNIFFSPFSLTLLKT